MQFQEVHRISKCTEFTIIAAAGEMQIDSVELD
jgi:hypothetical protein